MELWVLLFAIVIIWHMSLTGLALPPPMGIILTVLAIGLVFVVLFKDALF